MQTPVKLAKLANNLHKMYSDTYTGASIAIRVVEIFKRLGVKPLNDRPHPQSPFYVSFAVAVYICVNIDLRSRGIFPHKVANLEYMLWEAVKGFTDVTELTSVEIAFSGDAVAGVSIGPYFELGYNLELKKTITSKTAVLLNYFPIE